MENLIIDFRIWNRNMVEDYYYSPEYYPVPFHDFVIICEKNQIDPVEWYKSSLETTIKTQFLAPLSGNSLVSVLKKRINLPLGLFESCFIHLCVLYKGNIFEICDYDAPLNSLCSINGSNSFISVILVLDNQPEGAAYAENQLHFYFHSKEQGKHHLPHVHVIYSPGKEVVMNIITGEEIEGCFPNTKLSKQAKHIIAERRDDFIDWWNNKTDGLKIDINYALGITCYKGDIMH